MKLKTALTGAGIVAIFILVISSANAFSVTGKQITPIHLGNNNQEITITNSGDDILIVAITATKEQYYTPQNVSFVLTENWEQKFKEYEWQRVEWVNTKYGEAILAPHTTETVGFTINVPDGVADGTFYAKVEVKDIGKKEGMVVIRPIYVSQVVAHIENNNNKANAFSVPLSSSIVFFSILLSVIITVLVRRKRKNEANQ